MTGVALNLVLIVASVAALVGVMIAVKLVARSLHLDAELQRKIVHVATGLYALTLPLWFDRGWPVLVLVGLALAVMIALRLPALARLGLASALHGVERTSYGEMFLAAAVGFIFLRSQGATIFYVLPIAVLTLSDAAAALVGTRYGRSLFQVESGTKSWEGVVIFFLVTALLAMILLLLMTEVPRERVVLLALVIAAFGASIEADSWKGLDNLFVPVAIHLFLASHIDTPAMSLALLALGYVAAVVLLLLFAPALGLSAHSARAYIALVFVMCAVTAPRNAVLPVLAALAHHVAHLRRPCVSDYPELDMIAVSAGIALFWLFIGEYAGLLALNVYNLTFAGVLVVFAVIAARGLLAAAGAVLLGMAVLLVVAHLNPSDAQWYGMLWPWALAALSLAAGIAWAQPLLFDRSRVARAFLVALPIPCFLFVFHLVWP